MKDNMSWWARRTHALYSDRVIQSGFRPYLDAMIADLQRDWKANGCSATMTFFSRMPDVVDYWEPNFCKTFLSDWAIVASAENLARAGCTERLMVHEGWLLEPENGTKAESIEQVYQLADAHQLKRKQEVLYVSLVTRNSVLFLVYKILSRRHEKVSVQARRVGVGR